ncbi:MMPL family transporter [Paenibacillus sp. TRM 82003]|uniref:MMPL family transporter n=1 Tax=Kineococcus sp. TRM81007 TaxID=2925831 RepID=UPI001F588826|nr:MMPL family transporter [Kineococcus sp. TRM81007]MCI2237270.1 MMPL family transporter [Kineococcus sp. TRM81007]MCI3919329.1 MMPL family transporter [Paenibacillus sp. TRM 82003]
MPEQSLVARTVGRVVTGRVTAWLVLLAALLAAGAVAVGKGEAPPSQAGGTRLPDSAESARVAQLLEEFPGEESAPALVVWTREDGGALTGADTGAAAAAVQRLNPLAVGGQASGPIPSEDGRALLAVVPLPAGTSDEETAQAVGDVRAASRADLPEGLRAQVTGGPAFGVDIADSFSGANTRLLLVTAGVVALLLLVTYRSPVLWLVPLAVVGIGDQTAAGLLTVVDRVGGTPADPSSTGITSVLVFGAGTNYALLLIARYREELRRTPDRRLAMRRALAGAGPAILASACTVVLAVLTLLAAVLPSNRSLGIDVAVGIVVAGVFGLLVLPAALVVCGRGLFWPFVPRVGSQDTSRTGGWARIADRVVRRPWPVVGLSVLLLAALAAGLVGVQQGLSRTEQFRTSAEAVEGAETLQVHYPAQGTEPAQVVAAAGAAGRVLAAASAVPGAASAQVVATAGDLVRIDAAIEAEPGSAASRATVERLREAVGAVPGADALVGGTEAEAADERAAAQRDLLVVGPLVVAVVLAVLVVLLRALLGPVLLVVTVLATYAAALGAGNLLFENVFGFPALDTGVPLFSLLFLVALGVDYNIFLVTRAREEALTAGTRDGIRTAVAVTGGVITSAGVLLAAVFTVLGVLPLITLTQIGVVVCIGVLLDTLLVRTLLVPAIVSLLGERFWWPGRVARADGPRHRVPAP